MMTKWDTIQADVADQYAYLDEEEQEVELDDEDIWGHEVSLEALAELELEDEELE